MDFGRKIFIGRKSKFLIQILEERRICVAKLLDEKGNIIGIDTRLFSILAQCDIKLSIKIIISPFAIAYYDRSISLLCYIVENLKNTIYSFEIDFGNYYLTKNNYDRVSKVIMKIPNLIILKLSNVHIQWKLFLLCIKSIQKLEELDLSEISMFTDVPLFNDTYSDLERQEFDIKDLKKIWTESLKHLKGLRIAGNKSVLSYNETVQVVEVNLMQIILPAIQNLKMLRSLDLSSNEDFFPEDIRRIKKLFENLFLKIDE